MPTSTKWNIAGVGFAALCVALSTTAALTEQPLLPTLALVGGGMAALLSALLCVAVAAIHKDEHP